MPQLFLEIADDEQPDPEVIANPDDVPVDLGEKGELQHDDLRDPALDDDLFEVVGIAQHRDAVLGFFDFLVADEADRPQTDVRLAPQPAAQLRGFGGRSHQNRFFLARTRENSPGEKLGEVVMGEEQRDIEPWDEVEEENTRDERVLGRDQIKDQRPDAGEGLAQAQPMLAEQFVLEKIILRAVTAERFERHPQDEQAAVNAVAAPGPFRSAIGIKRHHYPDAQPEEEGDNDDLAEQENAIESLRALRDHVIARCPGGEYAMARRVQLVVKPGRP